MYFLLSNKNFMLKTKHFYELKLNEIKHNIYNADVIYVKVIQILFFYNNHIQSNLVNPTPFVAHSFTPDSKVSGLSNQLY